MIQSIEDGVNCDDAERIGAQIQTLTDHEHVRRSKTAVSFIYTSSTHYLYKIRIHIWRIAQTAQHATIQRLTTQHAATHVRYIVIHVWSDSDSALASVGHQKVK